MGMAEFGRLAHHRNRKRKGAGSGARVGKDALCSGTGCRQGDVGQTCDTTWRTAEERSVAGEAPLRTI